MRQSIVAGNWKMNGTKQFAVEISQQMNLHAKTLQNVEVVLSPSSVYLSQVQDDASGYSVAAQNIHYEDAGAFTGELAVSMIADIGCKYVLVGHSERREMFGDDEQSVARKVSAVIGASLIPILCVGESLMQRKADNAYDVVKQQILSALAGLSLTGDEFVIAYEPIWAIGTGETASPEQAQEMHAFIRQVLSDRIAADLAVKVRILYGGSVSAATAQQLFAQPDIDGGLVGGASLKVEDFKVICSAAAK